MEQKIVSSILINRIPNIRTFKSEEEIEDIVSKITDIIQKTCSYKKGDIYCIFTDICGILVDVSILSKETKVEIVKDIIEYIMNQF
jgi:hypothetical protein